MNYAIGEKKRARSDAASDRQNHKHVVSGP
jgi:hypothetical protein